MGIPRGERVGGRVVGIAVVLLGEEPDLGARRDGEGAGVGASWCSSTLGSVDLPAAFAPFGSRVGAWPHPCRAASGPELRRERRSTAWGARARVLLDEPSNHLDDSWLDRLVRWLVEFPGIAVFVTHDRWLLDAVATAIYDLDPALGAGGTLFGESFRIPRGARRDAARMAPTVRLRPGQRGRSRAAGGSAGPTSPSSRLARPSPAR